MKNLKKYNANTFDCFSSAVDRKRDIIVKTRLEAIKPIINTAYKNYSKKLQENSIHSIIPHKTFQNDLTLKNDLLGMYSYSSSIVRSIRHNIEAQQTIATKGICQNCTINHANTMDHLLPQKLYPEFAVNGENLFPCCGECNEYKGDICAPHSFLNLYSDILPKQEYLFVRVDFTDEILDFEFYLDNPNGIENILFNTITNHYHNLRLLQRLKDKANSELSEFIIPIKTQYRKLDKQAIIDSVNESISELREVYGYNYWKCCLHHALINSPHFWEYLDQQLL